MHRVLVCGGRDFCSVPRLPWQTSQKEIVLYKKIAERQVELLNMVLNRANVKYDIRCIIHGGARGADTFAGAWAERNNIPCEEYKADWNKHGKRAGPIRNQEMLDEAKPTLVIAFPGGTGTRDMISRAKKAGVRVIEVPNVVTTRRN